MSEFLTMLLPAVVHSVLQEREEMNNAILHVTFLVVLFSNINNNDEDGNEGSFLCHVVSLHSVTCLSELFKVS